MSLIDNRECDRCGCTIFDVPPAWLPKPTADGLWWGNFGGATNCYMVLQNKCYLHGESHNNATPLDRMPRGWWLSVTPAPPAPPLPHPHKKQVNLSAKLYHKPLGDAYCEIYANDKLIDSIWSKDAITCSLIVNEKYGIEPEEAK